MIPKFRMWNRITSKLHCVYGLYFDSKEVQYTDEVGILRFIKFENTILMQSTGLKDKNGKEIFEGDIVTDGEFARIVQYHQTLGFYMFDEEGNERFFSDSATLEDFEEDAKIVSEILEIIGNIYENPEYDQNFVGFRIKGE